MKFINKWYYIIWVVIIMISYFISANAVVVCYDDFIADEEKLLEYCNTTEEGYWQQVEINNSFCPEGERAFSPSGGCYPDLHLGFVLIFIIFASTIYNIIYSILFLIIKKIRKNSTIQPHPNLQE